VQVVNTPLPVQGTVINAMDKQTGDYWASSTILAYEVRHHP